MNETAIVVGGGLAGLATAVGLARNGVGVTVLESRPRLGGRASSFQDRDSGIAIDNCQHVSMGCCTNFRHFCETVGIADAFQTQKSLYFVGPPTSGTTPGVHRFSAQMLPAPLHLAFAFRRLSYLSPADRRQLIRGLSRLWKINPDDCHDITALDWLQTQGQGENVIRNFWHVVLVSALSETLDRISLYHARKVFIDGFIANRHGWEVSIPTRPLDELYGTQLTRWLAEHAAEVRLQTGVKRLQVVDDRVMHVELRNGETLTADQFILAIPFERVSALLPNDLATHPSLAGISQLESTPIASVHLWFDRSITPLPHAVFVDRLSQWMFNRTALQGGKGKKSQADTGGLFYYQVVISAARDLPGNSQQDTIDEVVRELREVWPMAKEAGLVHARMVTEHQAVFSVKPGVEQLRPPQQSPIVNLQLAGDWTRTGWPGTMEGAVRSGYLAAENVLRNVGRPADLLQPDLPLGFFSRRLLRRP